MKPQLIAYTFVCCTAVASASALSADLTQVLTQRVQTDVGWSPELRLVDLNNDGNIDIFYDGAGTGVTHYLGDGSGSFDESIKLLEEEPFYLDTLLADFDNDGYPDLFADGFYPGIGGVAYGTRIDADSRLLECFDWTTIDINSDGLDDIVCSVDIKLDPVFTRRFGFRTFLNEGNFSFSEKTSYFGAYALENSVSAIAVGDINNDSKDDIVQVAQMVSRNGARTNFKIEHHRVSSHLYQDDIPHNLTDSFTTTQLHDADQAWSGDTVKSAELIDLNNDGNLDLVLLMGSGHFSNRLTGYIAVLPGNGDGSFIQQPIKTPLGSPLNSDFELADIDEDGVTDLVVSYWYNHDLETQLGLSISYGIGDGTFDEPQNLLPESDIVWQVDTADINGDGKRDIVAIENWNAGGHIVAFSANAGAAQETPLQTICKYVASDTDNDGWGWENNQSCRITAASSLSAPSATTTLILRNPSIALCSNSDADADGDGWGWENGASCQVEEQVDFNNNVPATRPVCQYPWRDEDNDGWGFENGLSCIVSR